MKSNMDQRAINIIVNFYYAIETEYQSGVLKDQLENKDLDLLRELIFEVNEYGVAAKTILSIFERFSILDKYVNSDDFQYLNKFATRV